MSHYALSDMLGKAHSLVRHPDMPRAVFKVLWDTILSGQPISAYVKNLASDGSYYWVFATVFPVGEDFVSIRVKPVAGILPKVEELYKTLKKAEATVPLEQSVNDLVKGIQELGFANYMEFTNFALGKEYEALYDELNAFEVDLNLAPDVASVPQLLKTVQNLVNDAFRLFDATTASLTSLNGSFSQLESIAREYDLLPINLSLCSQKGGPSQRTTEILAQLFSKQKAEVLAFMTEFRDTMGQTGAQSILPLRYAVGSCFLQVSMIYQFLSDVFSGSQSGTGLSPEAASSECVTLAEMTQNQIDLCLQSIRDLKVRFVKILGQKDELNVIVNSVSSIAQIGQIETSRDAVLSATTRTHVEEMKEMANRIGEGMKSVNSSLVQANEALDHVAEKLQAASKDILRAQLVLKRVRQLRTQAGESFDTAA